MLEGNGGRQARHETSRHQAKVGYKPWRNIPRVGDFRKGSASIITGRNPISKKRKEGGHSKCGIGSAKPEGTPANRRGTIVKKSNGDYRPAIVVEIAWTGDR